MGMRKRFLGTSLLNRGIGILYNKDGGLSRVIGYQIDARSGEN